MSEISSLRWTRVSIRESRPLRKTQLPLSALISAIERHSSTAKRASNELARRGCNVGQS